MWIQKIGRTTNFFLLLYCCCWIWDPGSVTLVHYGTTTSTYQLKHFYIGLLRKTVFMFVSRGNFYIRIYFYYTWRKRIYKKSSKLLPVMVKICHDTFCRDVNEKRRSRCSCCGWSRRANRSSSSSSWAAATGSGRRGSFSTTQTAVGVEGRRMRRGSGRRGGVSQGHPWTLPSKRCSKA